MNKLVLLTVCLISLIGCEGKTLDELRAEVAAREAVTAEARRTTFKFIGTSGYPREVIKICLEGVQYYYGDITHSGILAPVINRTSMTPASCEK